MADELENTPCALMGEAMARYKHDELTAGEAVSIILEQAKRLSQAPMEAVAWRARYAVGKTVDTWSLHETEPKWLTSDGSGDYEVQALAVIPTEGLGSSLRDTHRVAETAVVGWQPIENAPEVDYDAPVLVFSAGDPPAYDVAWVGWHDEAGKPVWYNGDVAVVWATHWMPLPAAPVSDAIGEENQ